MKAWWIPAAIVALIMLVTGMRLLAPESGGSVSGTATEGTMPMNITAEQLQKMIGNQPREPLLILDVREPDEFASGHIPNAVLLPLGNVEKEMAKLPRDRALITVCRSGRRSAAAADILVKGGFTKVHNLLGGMLAWPYETTR